MKTKVLQFLAMVVLAEAEIPLALAVTFRAEQLHASHPTARPKSHHSDMCFTASTSHQIASPRRLRVGRVPAKRKSQAKREHE